MSIKTKTEYIQAFKEKYSSCREEAEIEYPNNVDVAADALFTLKASADEIVGCYLYKYQDKAMDAWNEYLSLKQVPLDEIDKAVTAILSNIDGTGEELTEVEITIEHTFRYSDTFMVTKEQLEQLKCGENPFLDDMIENAMEYGVATSDYAVNDSNGRTIVDWL